MVTSAAELVTVLLTNILQDFMNIMRDFVPPQDIVRRVIGDGDGDSNKNNTTNSSSNNSSGSTLGEFKEVITSMVIADVQELALSHTIQRICKEDLTVLSKSKGNNMVSMF